MKHIEYIRIHIKHAILHFSQESPWIKWEVFGWLCLLISIAFVPRPSAKSLTQPPTLGVAQQNNGLSLPIIFHHLKASEISSLGSVFAIEQDKQGFIWLGGRNGLLRYDGYEFKAFRNHPQNPNTLSNNYIYDLLLDSQDRLWVATAFGLNRYDFDTHKFTRFYHNENNPGSIGDNAITDILEDRQGNLWFSTYHEGISVLYRGETQFSHFRSDKHSRNSVSDNTLFTLAEDDHGFIWIGTRKNGVDRFNPRTREFQNFRHNPNDQSSLSGNTVSRIFVDKDNNVWVGTDSSGLNRFERETLTFTRYNPKSGTNNVLAGRVLDITQDQAGRLWVATYGRKTGKVSILDIKTGTFTHHEHDINNPSSIASRHVHRFFEDRVGDIWLGFYPASVDRYSPSMPSFLNYRHHRDDKNSLSHPVVMTVAEAKGDNLWIGTNGGLDYLDRKTGAFTHYTFAAEDPYSLRSAFASAIVEDSFNTLWVGTWGGGLSRLNLEEPDNKKFIHYPTRNSQEYSSSIIWSIYEDRNRELWVGTQEGGLMRYNRKSNYFTHYTFQKNNPNSLSHTLVWTMMEDSAGNFWIGTHEGLNLMDREKETFKRILYSPDNPNGLSNGSIMAIAEDKDGSLWLGTAAGLNKYDPKSGKIDTFRTQDGLLDDFITSVFVVENEIWMSTQKGISRFDIQSGTFQNYDKRYGTASDVFMDTTATMTQKGELIFGGNEGITILDPKSIRRNTTPPPIAITDFQLANKTVPIGTTNSPLAKTIERTSELTLNYQQSVFSFSFAALNFRIPEKSKYAYRLQGFEKEWQHVGSKRSATYTNLNPGKYIFEVKATNDEGIWNENPASISITITPPPWKTWWAYALYLIFTCGLFYFIVIYILRKKIYENESRLNSHLQNMDKVKDEFLANTSHELRTPLNGMIGIATSLVDGAAGPVSNKMRKNLELIAISGKRLATLINDILDFSKLKNNSIKLNKSHFDISTMADVILTLLHPLADQKHLELKNHIPKDTPIVLADEDRIQQVLYNLVGNAIKFTDAGKVELYSTQINKYLEIQIKDTGIGIPAEKLESVFDSFEQASETRGGTGLGLAITKQLMDLHEGNITIESKLGSGTTVTLQLPLEVNDYHCHSAKLNMPRPLDNTIESLHEEIKLDEKNDDEHHDVHENTAFNILIVDDDPINRLVVRNYLQLHRYHVFEAHNGKDALVILTGDKKIDLVLLDVMLPSLSGLEVCGKLRQTVASTELPVIFLTALASDADLHTGMQVGGNDFLTKPVSKDQLIARVSTHLELLKKNREDQQRELTDKHR